MAKTVVKLHDLIDRSTANLDLEDLRLIRNALDESREELQDNLSVHHSCLVSGDGGPAILKAALEAVNNLHKVERLVSILNRKLTREDLIRAYDLGHDECPK